VFMVGKREEGNEEGKGNAVAGSSMLNP